MSFLDKTFEIITWPVRTVAHAATTLTNAIREYFAHPTIEQLVNADTGIQLGLGVFSFFYAIVFFLSGAPIMGLIFAACGAYYTWMLVKLTPWWNRLIQFVWIEEAWNDSGLADGTISTAA